MTATINQCLAQLKIDFDAGLSANTVYDYRTFPDKLTQSVSLSYQGQIRAGGTAAGSDVIFDVTAVIFTQIDMTEGDPQTALRDAEQALNALEDGIYTLLEKGGVSYRNSLWRQVSLPSPSIRPPSPIEAPTTRWGEIPFRVHLK